uniref:Putative meningioma n=1 Tax=Ixodes ricinus TaxID=34613 RepID=A0A0K8RC83_IXORI
MTNVPLGNPYHFLQFQNILTCCKIPEFFYHLVSPHRKPPGSHWPSVKTGGRPSCFWPHLGQSLFCEYPSLSEKGSWQGKFLAELPVLRGNSTLFSPPQTVLCHHLAWCTSLA